MEQFNEPYSMQVEFDVISMLINANSKEEQNKSKEIIEQRGGISLFYTSDCRNLYQYFISIDREEKLITPASYSISEEFGKEIYKELRRGKKMFGISEFIAMVSELKNLKVLRQIMEVNREALDKCYRREETINLVEEQLATLEAIKDRELCDKNTKENEMASIIERFKENLQKGENADNVVRYGIKFLDDRYYHERGQTHLIGATPGTGKTAMGLTIFLSCIKQGKKCVFFVKESSAEELFARLISMETGIAYKDIRQGSNKITANEMGKINKAIEFLNSKRENFSIYGNNSYNHSIMGIKAKMDIEQKKKKGIDLVVIDYIQNMETPITHSKKANHEIIGYNMEQCNKMFQKYKCAGIVLSQLNRELNGKPRLKNLKGSSVLEQEAHIITFLHRESVAVREGRYIEVEMYCEKQRLGELFEDVKLALIVPEAEFKEKSMYSLQDSRDLIENQF